MSNSELLTQGWATIHDAVMFLAVPSCLLESERRGQKSHLNSENFMKQMLYELPLRLFGQIVVSFGSM